MSVRQLVHRAEDGTFDLRDMTPDELSHELKLVERDRAALLEAVRMLVEEYGGPEQWRAFCSLRALAAQLGE